MTINQKTADASVSGRPKIICRHCVDQQRDSLVTEFQLHYSQWLWRHRKVGGAFPHCVKIWGRIWGHPPLHPIACSTPDAWRTYVVAFGLAMRDWILIIWALTVSDKMWPMNCQWTMSIWGLNEFSPRFTAWRRRTEYSVVLQTSWGAIYICIYYYGSS